MCCVESGKACFEFRQLSFCFKYICAFLREHENAALSNRKPVHNSKYYALSTYPNLFKLYSKWFFFLIVISSIRGLDSTYCDDVGTSHVPGEQRVIKLLD